MRRSTKRSILYAILPGTQVAGRQLRNALNKGKSYWHRWSVGGFYTAMSKMEDEEFVIGSDHVREGEGIPYKERRYVVTQKGLDFLNMEGNQS